MTLDDVLNQIIDDGIKAARADYVQPRDKPKRDGSIRGFEECRGKTPAEIKRLLLHAHMQADLAFRQEASDYWYWRCLAAEVLGGGAGKPPAPA